MVVKTEIQWGIEPGSAAVGKKGEIKPVSSQGLEKVPRKKHTGKERKENLDLTAVSSSRPGGKGGG